MLTASPRRAPPAFGSGIGRATKQLPKWLGCEPGLIVLSLDSENGSIDLCNNAEVEE